MRSPLVLKIELSLVFSLSIYFYLAVIARPLNGDNYRDNYRVFWLIGYRQ